MVHGLPQLKRMNDEAAAKSSASDCCLPVCACGLPMSVNPHPDAGKVDALLMVGAMHVCIPCTVASRHKSNALRRSAESNSIRLMIVLTDQIEEARKERLTADGEDRVFVNGKVDALEALRKTITVAKASERLTPELLGELHDRILNDPIVN